MSAPKRPAGYVRVSQDRFAKSDDPDEVGKAVRRQWDAIVQRAKDKGWPEPVKYEDNDLSASKDVERPNYDRLWSALESGEHDALIIYDVDRFTRKPEENEPFMKLIEKSGAQLENIMGDVDLATANGRMLFRFKTAIARQESERIAERISAKNLQRAQDGEPVISHVRPYGYAQVGHTLEVIPAESLIVQEIYRRYLKGEAINAIARDFNKREIPTVGGGRWRDSTVRSILKAPKVAALAVYKEQIYPGKWTAIIKPAEWQKVQDKLAEKAAPAGQNARRHLFSGFVYCDDCLTKMKVKGPSYVCPDCYRKRSKKAVDAYLTDLVLQMKPAEVILTKLDRSLVEQLTAEIASVQAAYKAREIELSDSLTMLKELRARLKDAEANMPVITVEKLEGVPMTVEALTANLTTVNMEESESFQELNLSQQRAYVAARINAVTVLACGPGKKFDPDTMLRIDPTSD